MQAVLAMHVKEEVRGFLKHANSSFICKQGLQMQTVHELCFGRLLSVSIITRQMLMCSIQFSL